ncbi:hypothetical protein D3C72_1612450 [compost metagenome]
MRLAVAVQPGLRRAVLAHALIGIADQVAFQNGAAGRDDQRAGVPSHRITVLVARARRQQRVVETARGLLAPTIGMLLVAAINAGVQQVGRRPIGRVEPPVLTAQPRLLQGAGLHVQRAARQVDGRTGLRHHLGAFEADLPALRQPVAGRHRQRAHIAAHFQQASSAVPAVALVAAHAAGHADQRTAVQPHVGIVEPGAVAVDR